MMGSTFLAPSRLCLSSDTLTWSSNCSRCCSSTPSSTSHPVFDNSARSILSRVSCPRSCWFILELMRFCAVDEYQTPTYGVDGVGSSVGAIRNSFKISWPSGILYILSTGISIEREVIWGSIPRKLKTSRERGYMKILRECITVLLIERPHTMIPAPRWPFRCSVVFSMMQTGIPLRRKVKARMRPEGPAPTCRLDNKVSVNPIRKRLHPSRRFNRHIQSRLWGIPKQKTCSSSCLKFCW
jgi:hypothetical protein